MPVNTPHISYNRQRPVWDRIRTCVEGAEAVKRAGEAYLPKLTGQEVDEYEKYKARALYFNGSGRTLEAMEGFVMRKPPAFEIPAGMEPWQDDMDLAGNSLITYARQVLNSVCSLGRCGTLVDWSDAEGRPYFAFYDALCILNWNTARIGGQMKLTLLVLHEPLLVRSGTDAFQMELMNRYRVFELTNEGQVQYSVYQEQNGEPATATTNAPGTGPGKKGNEPKLMEGPMVLSRRGKPLDRIPFVFHNADSAGAEICKSPMDDITAVNISHYQTSADLENGRHICGVPTPYAVCFESPGKLYLGTSYAWVSDNPAAKCGWLEFTGAGLSALSDGLKEKQEQMASLGARLIEQRGGDAEAYETVALRASAETSTLARIGLLTSAGLTEALRLAEWWTSTGDLDPSITFSLNTDFTSSGITPEMLTALISAYQQSAISRDTLFFQLERGEMFAAGTTMEEEMERIESTPPIMPPAPTDPTDPGKKPPAKKVAKKSAGK